ncbi:MAG: RNA-binding transcriptional accessory protein [Ruminococcaceae bacterium]|nr:RNA-binding transcriptional accessory protein [Oscillospiraceae bacterium]MBQ2773747.1 RNA-binding transcriptional accessory protein [Clostridia bacterium]
MAQNIFETLAKELSLTKDQVEKTVALMDEGNTIPFISRYRKEVTGSLDDTQLRKLEERLKYLRNIEARRVEVKNLIAAQEKLTPEIERAIENAVTITEIDDIYRPFRPKRKTRASVARERGLEPLAEALMAQHKIYEPSLDDRAAALVDPEKGVNTPEEAFAGAMDIIAEDISDNADYRKGVRALTVAHGLIETKKAKDEPSVYEQYYDHSEPVKKIPGHRVLAINRGEKEEFLKVSVTVPTDIVLNYLFSLVVKSGESPAKKYVSAAVTDSYERLIAPSVEREIRNDLFDAASEGAIVLFSDNLQHLLMQAPIKGKTVLGFDPGYAHGCKLAVCDKTGKVLDTAVIYLHRENQAKDIMKRLITRWGVDVVAIGNGTASRESEKFVAAILREMNVKTKYIIVSEAGASVYSASKLAADEFPEFDVMQRSAVSIARRLQDPLAELVKIDPKAIGVGQYQHDMKPARLDEALSGVVEDCVNRVGVDLNTASHSLLSYISGVNAVSAKNIVKYREENGEFRTRAEVLKVPRIGAKAYEQCAGFLRVPGSSEVMDNTGVHPESYAAAHALLKRFGYTEEDVRAGKLAGISAQVAKQGAAKLAAELGIGEPTLVDIAAELEKPGRDLRDDFAPPLLSEDVLEMTDLKPGQVLSGTVRNVIDFGAFVDIGVHQDGLVHISELSDKFVKHPRDVVSVGDIVRVRVLSVDVAKKRIALSMKTMKNEG